MVSKSGLVLCFILYILHPQTVDARKSLTKEISNEIDTGPETPVSKQKSDRRYNQQVNALDDVLPSHVAKVKAGLIKPKKESGHWKKVSLKSNTRGDQDNYHLQQLDYTPQKQKKVNRDKYRLLKKPTKMGKKKSYGFKKSDKYRKYKKHFNKNNNKNINVNKNKINKSQVP